MNEDKVKFTDEEINQETNKMIQGPNLERISKLWKEDLEN